MVGRNLRPGLYGCSSGGGVSGWFIRSGTQSPYGHAFIVGTGGRVIEARPGGVGYGDLDRYVRGGAVFNDQEPLDEITAGNIVRTATTLLGADYDWPAILDLGLRVLGRKTEALPVGSHGRFICSQFVTVVATAAGKVYCPDLDRWVVSPRTLADRITARPWVDEDQDVEPPRP